MSLVSRVLANSILAWSNYSPFERPDRFRRAVYASASWGSGIATHTG